MPLKVAGREVVVSLALHAMVGGLLLALVPVRAPKPPLLTPRLSGAIVALAPPLPPLPPRGTTSSPRRELPRRAAAPIQPVARPLDETPVVVPPDAPIAPAVEVAPRELNGQPDGDPDRTATGVEGGDEQGMEGGFWHGRRGGRSGGTGTAVGSDYDRPPSVVHETRPVYPPEAARRRVEGTVLVEIVVDVHGAVIDAEVAQSIPLLDAAALTAVRRWRFAPAFRSGQPVASRVQVAVRFQLL